MQKIETICIIPVWKRPEILRIIVDNNSKYRTKDFDFAYIVSEEDPNITEILDILEHDIIYFAPNYPVSEKLNEGIRLIKQEFEFKYLMNMGSDDLIIADIMQIYQPYVKNSIKLFGFNACYTKNINNAQIYTLKNLHQDHPMGAGRMIHRSLLDSDIYSNDLNRGLDSNSMANINTKAILLNGIAPIIDLKSNTNLNTIEFLKNCGNLTEVDKIDY